MVSVEQKYADLLDDWRYLVDEGHALQVQKEDLERQALRLYIHTFTQEWRK